MLINSRFKFLDSYTREDRTILFSNDREIEVLYHNLCKSKLMLVFGYSGKGNYHCKRFVLPMLLQAQLQTS